MENLQNLCPFYVGQKVVMIENFKRQLTNHERNLGIKIPTKGNIYTVREVERGSHGGWFIKLVEIVNPSAAFIDSYGEPTWNVVKFAPIKEQKFPLIKLTRIIEKELVSAN